MNTQLGFQPRSGSMSGNRQRVGSMSRSNLSTVQDMDTLDDMEMDDISFDNLAPIEEQTQQYPVQHNQFNQGQNQLPQLNVNLANSMQNHQGLRTSTPTTPSANQQFNLQNNPTVSSVNTPTLGTMPMTHNLTSPESSHPGTPAELDMDFAGFNPMMGMGDMGMGMNGMNGINMNMNFNGNFAMNGMNGFDNNNGTIDQPGKRLFSKQGAGLSQAQLNAALKNYQLGGNDQSELARRLREQQLSFPSPRRSSLSGVQSLAARRPTRTRTVSSTTSNTVTRTSSSRKTRTAPSRSLTHSHPFLTQALSVWRKRSHIAVRCVVSATRT
jgi:transcription factor SFP1